MSNNGLPEFGRSFSLDTPALARGSSFTYPVLSRNPSTILFLKPEISEDHNMSSSESETLDNFEIYEITHPIEKSSDSVIEDVLQSHQTAQSKICTSLSDALAQIENGSIIMIGGFAYCGVPENLIGGLIGKNLNNLHVIAGTGGSDDYGPGILAKFGMVSRIDTTFVGSSEINKQFYGGKLELNILPQGDFAEKVRAARAGIPAFFTSTGVDTDIETGLIPVKYADGGHEVEKFSEIPETKEFDGQKFLMLRSYKSDFSLIKAWKADSKGNLIYHSTARNFNALMAGASRITIAEVEEIVEDLEFTPDMIHTPGIYVDRIFKGDFFEKPIGVLATKIGNQILLPHHRLDKRLRIARRAAKEVQPGSIVNLGLGIPTLVSNFVDPEIGALMHGENGVLGMGPFPVPGDADPDTMNPSRQSISLSKGASTFSSDTSFDMIRGGHIETTMLGALQVSKDGDIANWIIPGKRAIGMGGAPELAKNCKNVIVCMEHTAGGEQKILEKCTFPVTQVKCVTKIITDCGVFEIRKERGLVLVEISEDISLENLQKITGCDFKVAEDLKIMQF